MVPRVTPPDVRHGSTVYTKGPLGMTGRLSLLSWMLMVIVVLSLRPPLSVTLTVKFTMVGIAPLSTLYSPLEVIFPLLGSILKERDNYVKIIK